jgi:hypothetical protein
MAQKQNTMNTLENNKLLLEFLDNVFKVSTFKGELLIENIQSWKHYEDYDEIEFDFNLLMEVVEKIESLKPFQLMDRNWIGFDVKIYKTFNTQTHYCTIKYLKEQGDMTISNGFSKSNKIESVYNACVEFVKWYNENK